MDPITAVGLASSVAQLVDVSWKVVSKSREIYRNGALPEHRDLETVTADLQRINGKLLGFLNLAESSKEVGEDDEALRQLCESSNLIATELIRRLATVNPGDAHRNWRSIRQALKSVWIKNELDETATRLQSYRTQLNTRILVSLRDRVDNLSQGNKRILESISDSRVLHSTSQEIQTDYLTRLITSQHEKTRELLVGLGPNKPAPPPYSALPGRGSSPGIDPKQAAFDAVGEGSVPKIRRILRDDPSIIFVYDSSGRTLLHVAASKGDVEMVSYLVRNSAKINPDDDDGKLPIHDAAAVGGEPVVRALVANGADVLAKNSQGIRARDLCDPSSLLHWIMVHGAQLEVKDEYGRTALRYFAEHGDMEAVRVLLAQGADLETTGGWAAQTPLSVASDRGRVEMVELLLSHGAKVDCGDIRKSTPLVTAGWSGHTRVGEVLLDHGADIDAANQHAFTALSECCDHARVEMGLMLVARGARLDSFNQFGYAPIHQAAMHGHLDLVRAMLDRGADVDILNNQAHWTALAEACHHGHLEIVELLVSRGARTEEWSGDDRKTALIRAAEGGYTEIVRAMLERGNANPEAGDKEGKTALYHAVARGCTETARVLVSKGANGEVHDQLQYTPLCRAAQSGFADIARMLVDAGARVNHPNFDGWTPLHEASGHGHEEIVQILVTKGAVTDVRDKNMYTPLHRASQNGHLSIALLLLDSGGADVNLQNVDGWTPLAEASWHGHLKLVRAYLQRGARTDIRNRSGDTALALAKAARHGPVIEVMEEYEKGGDGWEMLD